VPEADRRIRKKGGRDMSSDSTRVLVVGQGYVGLPLAMRAVEVGHLVTGYETSDDRVKRLLIGDSYVEDVSSEQLSAALATGRYRPSTDARACAGFDVAVLTVPTPLREGSPDLSHIEVAANTVARFLRPGATVVLESTTYPGTTDELLVPLLEEGSGLVAGEDFCVGYSPERIDPGNAVWNLVNTPKVVSGIDARSLASVSAFYRALVDEIIPVSSTREAELTKLLENTFRHVNIALVNELAMYAHDLGINVWEAIDAASTKPYGYMRFTPGPGVGGHCLPIDPSYLSWRVKRKLGQSFRFVELANDVNEHMPDYVVRRLVAGMNHRSKLVKGSRVLLVGVTYKKNTGDARETPARRVVEQLESFGADVVVHDPHLADIGSSDGWRLVELTEAELGSVDAVVLLADHDRIDYELLGRYEGYLLDTRRRLHGPNVETI
jgi:UDP-N-acetyl-D-glucosamine dehydrogenase